MEKITLPAKARAEVGKKATKKVRRDGLVPAVLYGHGMKPLSLEVGAKELYRALHTKAGENVIINMEVEGVKLKESTCLIKDIQHDPIRDGISHVDFTVISLTEKIQVKVPVVVLHQEEAAGVKEGGVLGIVHHEVEVECLPENIPAKIEIDIKAMKIGDAVHGKELAVGKDVKCLLPPDEVVLAIHHPAKEEAPAAEEAAAEPEVIEKGKKPEEEGAEETAGAKAQSQPKAAAPKAPEKK